MEKLVRVVLSGFTMVASGGGEGEEEEDGSSGLLPVGGRRGQYLRQANGGK